jgi:hypothetical protein
MSAAEVESDHTPLAWDECTARADTLTPKNADTKTEQMKRSERADGLV